MIEFKKERKYSSMGKATIIEAQNSQTVYEEGKSNSGILGHLKGVFADYQNGTRNSDRLYTEELWDNRVFGSEDVMEALETKTLFGELDHPEGDRCETLAKNAAISITKLEKKPDEGVIYGEADILDTPTGRIVKALADSGAKLGISSRGMGEEIYVDGQNIIDPDTYDFITFDVVVTPANTKARVSLTESKHLSKLTENFKKEITESETENQLNQIKTVVESVNLSNKDELVGLIDTKLETFKQPISNKLTEANRQIALDLLKEKYENMKTQLTETLSASESLSQENAKLVEEKEFLTTSRDMLKSKLKESIATNKEISDKLEESKKALEVNRAKRLEENAKHREIILKNRQVANLKTENTQTQLKEEIAKLEESKKALEESNALKDTQIKKLQEANNKSEQRVNEYSKILVENKKLLDKVKMLEQKNTTSQNKLQESKILENKKVLELENKIRELETKNAKMEEAQDRFSKLSFNPIGTVKAMTENFNRGEMTQEDIDLFNALTGK
jgi:hypothetical protein